MQISDTGPFKSRCKMLDIGNKLELGLRVLTQSQG